MCYAVYLGTEMELELSEFDETNPSFYIAEIQSKEEAAVKQHFSKPNVYYLGSHEGCGCGFAYEFSEWVDGDQVEDLNARKQSVEKFNDLLKRILSKTDDLEIFLSWEGDQNRKTEVSDVVNIDHFNNGSWVADKPTFYTVHKC